jgi:hypothetical protein
MRPTPDEDPRDPSGPGTSGLQRDRASAPTGSAVPMGVSFAEQRARAGELAAALRDAARSHGWDAAATQAIWSELHGLMEAVTTPRVGDGGAPGEG